MINEFQLYWLLKLDDIQILFIWVAVFAFLPALIGIIGVCSTDDGDKRPGYLKTASISGGIIALMLAASTFIPTTKQALIIYGVPSLLRNQAETLKIMDKIPLKLTKALDEYIDNLTKPEEKK